MPPPMIRRSHSTSVTSGLLQYENVQVSFSIYTYLLFCSCRPVKEPRLFKRCKIRRRLACIRINGTFCCCSYRELKSLQYPIPELDRPHNRVGASQWDSA